MPGQWWTWDRGSRGQGLAEELKRTALRGGEVVTHKELKVPLLDEYFFVPEETVFALEKFEHISGKHPVNILITGR
jgi:NAD(P)H-dependent FMN reductase